MALRLKTPLLIVILLALVAVLVACGPAAPSPADEPAGIMGPAQAIELDENTATGSQNSPQDNAPPLATPGGYQPPPPPPASGQEDPVFAPKPAWPTDWSTPTRGPTITPLPSDWVEPPTSPPYTPFPTLMPDPTPDGGAAGQADPTPEPSLAEQVTQYVSGKGRADDAFVRVKVLSHRSVKTPDGFEWPENKEPDLYFPEGSPATRVLTKLKVEETYHGALPEGYQLMSWLMYPNSLLDTGKEYILFVRIKYVGTEDFPGDSSKTHFSEEQLRALGGKVALAHGGHVWVIDGDTAWRVPSDHIGEVRWRRSPSAIDPATLNEEMVVKTPDGTQLGAARAGGERMSITNLVAAINAGLN